MVDENFLYPIVDTLTGSLTIFEYFYPPLTPSILFILIQNLFKKAPGVVLKDGATIINQWA